MHAVKIPRIFISIGASSPYAKIEKSAHYSLEK
jgi:hypothetical protein